MKGLGALQRHRLPHPPLQKSWIRHCSYCYRFLFNARHRQGGISDTAIRPSVRVSVPGRNGPRRAAALGYSHRRPPEMCGLRTRPRTDVDPPRVDPASAGGISSRRPRGDTSFSFPFIVFGDRKAGINSVSTDRRPWYTAMAVAGRQVSGRVWSGQPLSSVHAGVISRTDYQCTAQLLRPRRGYHVHRLSVGDGYR